jgi:two-component system, NarL family, sensor kinase
VTVEAPDALPPLPAAVEVACYRIALEALTNVARHAQARHCVVRLSLDDRGPEPPAECPPLGSALCLEIVDDGRGITPDARMGAGIVSMRERAIELGGTFTIEQPPEGGARVGARLPLPPGEERP